MTSIFPDIFAPPRTAANGLRGGLQEACKHRKFTFHQSPCNRFATLRPHGARQPIGRRVSPVHRPEGIHHEMVGPTRPIRGQVGGVGRLAGHEAGVLQEEDLSLRHRRHGIADHRPCASREESHGGWEKLVKEARYRFQGQRRPGPPPGTAQVGEHDDLRAGREQVIEGGYRTFDPRAVGHATTVERNVEVGSERHHPPGEGLPREITQGLLHGAVFFRESLPRQLFSGMRSA